MKKQLFKTMILIICFSMLFFVFSFPNKKVNANPLILAPGAVGAGVYAIGAAYVLSALAIAVIADELGYSDYSPGMNEHAKYVWNTMNSIAKDAFIASVDYAFSNNKQVLELPDEFVQEVQTNFFSSAIDAARVIPPDNNLTLVANRTVIQSGSNPERVLSYEFDWDWDLNEALYVVSLINGRLAGSTTYDPVTNLYTLKDVLGNRIYEFDWDWLKSLSPSVPKAIAQAFSLVLVPEHQLQKTGSVYTSLKVTTANAMQFDDVLTRNEADKLQIAIPDLSNITATYNDEPVTWDGTDYVDVNSVPVNIEDVEFDVPEIVINDGTAGYIDTNSNFVSINDVTIMPTNIGTIYSDAFPLNMYPDQVIYLGLNFTPWNTEARDVDVVFNPPGLGVYQDGNITARQEGTGTVTVTSVSVPSITTTFPMVVAQSNAPGQPGTGNDNPWLNWIFLIPFLDMFRSICMFLLRFFNFILSLPGIPSKELSNPGFNMLMNLSIGEDSKYFPNLIPITLGLLDLIRMMISAFMAMTVYKLVRRVLTG